MIQSDYHLHCNYCDGKNSLEEMVSHAYLKGMRSVGVSPHFPLKYPNDWTMREERFCDYIEAIQHLKLQCPQDRELGCFPNNQTQADIRSFRPLFRHKPLPRRRNSSGREQKWFPLSRKSQYRGCLT